MIAIIDSGGANIASVQFALQRLGADSVLTRDIDQIQSAERVLLPGVGAAPVAMQSLREAGLIEPIRQLRQPVLGICLGMQLLFRRSHEGDTDLLDIIDGDCTAFRPAPGRSVPHMGWNRLYPKRPHPLLADLPDVAHVYFVHSYFVSAEQKNTVFGSTYYSHWFDSAVGSENVFAVQFHPEKSQALGLRLLSNFVNWDGCT